MRLCRARAVAFAALLLSTSIPALAQEDEEGNFSIGLGGGMVQTAGNSDPYYTANFRARIGSRAAGGERQGSVFGFVEPEVGMWTSDTVQSGVTLETKDLLLGVNFGGAVRLRVFEYFVGGGVGYHFLDREAIQAGRVETIDDGTVGVNAHFGFDVHLSELFSIFGVGRLDLVQEDSGGNNDHQTKVFLGLRAHL